MENLETTNQENINTEFHSRLDISELQKSLEAVKAEIGKVIIGQESLIEHLLVALLSNGHVLIEGVPGVAKTITAKLLAKTIDVDFSRIQFTPDLLPADILGTMIYNQKSGDFEVRKGPIFSNFVLADEINRAPAKVQSALLEAMQEKQVSIGKETYFLEEPFLVMATQNPIEQEGTYPLPEAQVDRFMFKVNISYPTKEEERQIIRMNLGHEKPKVSQIIDKQAIVNARKIVRQIFMDETIEQYILDIVFATRNPKDSGLPKMENLIGYGASPRASINLALAAKAHAFLKKRAYVIPEDVRAVCYDVMRHRIGLTYEAEAENITTEDIISEILNKVIVP